MSEHFNSLYVGRVIHKRLRPVQHELSYGVFALLLDCSALSATAKELRFFSYNKFNLLSVHDRDHGDGRDLCAYLAEVARSADLGHDVDRFLMLSYPRILGYVFNPITVFFGIDAAARVRLMIYEVNNTFGDRKTYVLPVDPKSSDTIQQSCAKQLYVSPFNSDHGRYRFAIVPPGKTITIGVNLTTDLGPTLKAYFHGTQRQLSDKNLLHQVVRTGWLTVKVTIAIHYEALRLWLKGLRIRERPPAASVTVNYRTSSKESAR